MSTQKFKILRGSWEYFMEHDPETGGLSVVSSRKVGMIAKSAEYVRAETSKLLGSVPLPVVEARKAACFGCESLEVDGENWYCKSCGCPKWERSRLQVKWEMPAAVCPLSKWQVGE